MKTAIPGGCAHLRVRPNMRCNAYCIASANIYNCFVLYEVCYIRLSYVLYKAPLQCICILQAAAVCSALALHCCTRIVLALSGLNQTVNPWYYPLNWGIMPRWVISGKSMEWPIMKSIKASLRIFFLNLIKKSIKSRLDCSSHTCCGWTEYLL